MIGGVKKIFLKQFDETVFSLLCVNQAICNVQLLKLSIQSQAHISFRNVCLK